jgi:hypothetical protein
MGTRSGPVRRQKSLILSNSVSKAITQCDLPRRNDLDGRSNLSEEARAAFTLLSRDLHQSGDFFGVADAA